MLLLFLFFFFSHALRIQAATSEAAHTLCPNSCSGHGICLMSSATISCSCFPSYHGGDCSYRICPSGVAWVDFPSANNVAHSEFTECSNMGACDRTTGECKCRPGFTGAACESMLCPVGLSASGRLDVCSGHGRCLSVQSGANYEDFVQFFNRSNYSGWDADKVYGCDCDNGWEGSSCSRRSCPKGDDPYTTGQVQEVQALECTCSGSCAGSLRLVFQGQKTRPIPLTATAAFVKMRLEELANIDYVTVVILGSATQICTNGGAATQIQFLIPQGDVDTIAGILDSNTVGSVTLNVVHGSQISALAPSIPIADGTTEFVACSNRGICDYNSGQCTCFDGFTSSDGLGATGNRGDCGHFYWNLATFPTEKFCPLEVNPDTNLTSVCSGHGTCSSGSCVCDSGYGGSACLEKQCESVFAWFGSVGKYHSGKLECAGVGDCNRRTGICENCGGNWGTFYGDFCQSLSCETDDSGLPCSGNGECLSLREMASLVYSANGDLASISYNLPWDADMVRGCSCFRAMSVDNQYADNMQPSSHRFYSQEPQSYNRENLFRGPQAFAATSWSNYKCGSAFCPTGINPQTENARVGVTEIQQIHCKGATNGSFQLSFRANWSQPIPFDADAALLQIKLEEMFTVGKVKVTLADSKICNSNKIPAYLEFLTEFGDLPLMRSNTKGLNIIGFPPATVSAAMVSVSKERVGTFIDAECSGQGVCDRKTGICKCYTGFSSSNGSISSPGERGDCTFVDKYYLSSDRK